MASVSEPLTPHHHRQNHWSQPGSPSCPVTTTGRSGKNVPETSAAQNLDRGTALPIDVGCVLPRASAGSNVATPPKAHSPVAVWEMQYDPARGRKFYLCRETQESSWRTPCGVNVKILPHRPQHLPLQSLSQQQAGPRQHATKQVHLREQRPGEEDNDMEKQQNKQKQQQQSSSKRKAQKRVQQQQISAVSSNGSFALKRARSNSQSVPTTTVSAQPKAGGSILGSMVVHSAQLSPHQAGKPLHVMQARKRRQLRMEQLRKRRDRKRKFLPTIKRKTPADASAIQVLRPKSAAAHTHAGGRAPKQAVTPMPTHTPMRALSGAVPAWHAQLVEEATAILSRDVAPLDANFLIGTHDKPYTEIVHASATKERAGASTAAISCDNCAGDCAEYGFLAATRRGINARGCFASVLPGTHLDVSWGGDYDYNDSEITTKAADIHHVHQVGEVDVFLDI